MSFYLEIVTPEKKVFSGTVEKLTIPTESGQLTILSHHVPLFTPLIEGVVKVTTSKEKARKISIGKGMIEVAKEKVILLVQSPEQADRFSKLKAEKAEEKAKQFDKSKVVPKGTISTKGAFRRSFISFKDVKRRRKFSRFPITSPTPEKSL